jgi:glycosyltransferase involved in cell wall biosynthesis
MSKLSSITIAGNEAANIADCIDSLRFCDERIVVDGGSKDNTVAIAEKHGATVYHHPWTNHGKQKSRCYFLRLGFLDGRFLLAVFNAEGTYYRYLKAWLTPR